MLLNIVQPEWFVPVHGEYTHMVHHARLAESVGVPQDHVLVCEDGDVLTLVLRTTARPRSTSSGARCPSGFLYVDGIVGDVGQGVLRDRRNLAEEGLVVVIVTVDSTTGEVVTGPEIVTRGWVYAPEAEELLEEAKAAVLASLAGGGRRGRHRLRHPPPPLPAGPSASSSTSAPSAARRSSRWSWRSDRTLRPAQVDAVSRDARERTCSGRVPRMLLWVVVRVLAFGDARDQDAAWSRVGPLQEAAGPQAVGPHDHRGEGQGGAGRAGGAGAGPGRRRAASSPGTGPTSLAVCLFVVGAIFALGLWTDLAGPVGSGAGRRHRRGARAGPGSRCRSRASPSAWCCSGRAGPAAPTPTSRRTTTSRRRAAEPPTVRIAIGALLLFLADVGDPAPRLRPPVARAATSTTSAAPAARSAPWSRHR